MKSIDSPKPKIKYLLMNFFQLLFPSLNPNSTNSPIVKKNQTKMAKLTKEQLEEIIRNNKETFEEMAYERNQIVLSLGDKIATTSEKLFIKFFQNPLVDASLNALFTFRKFPTLGYCDHLPLGTVVKNNDEMLSFVLAGTSRTFEWQRKVETFVDYEGDTIRTVETIIPQADKAYLESLIPDKDIKNGAKEFHHYVDEDQVMGYGVADGFFANEFKNQFFITLALNDIPSLIKYIYMWKNGELTATQVLSKIGVACSVNVGLSIVSALSNLLIMTIIQSLVTKAGTKTFTVTIIARLMTAYGIHSLRNFIVRTPEKTINYEIPQEDINNQS